MWSGSRLKLRKSKSSDRPLADLRGAAWAIVPGGGVVRLLPPATWISATSASNVVDMSVLYCEVSQAAIILGMISAYC